MALSQSCVVIAVEINTKSAIVFFDNSFDFDTGSLIY